MIHKNIENVDLLKNVSVLYVEDEPSMVEGVRTILEKKVHKIQTAHNGKDGLQKYKQYHYDIIVADIKMPIMNGIEMVNHIKEIKPSVKVIYLSAYSDQPLLLQCLRSGADYFINKPASIKENLIYALEKVAYVLHKEHLLKNYTDTLQLIVDNVQTAIFTTDGQKLSSANKTFLSYLGMQSLKEFQNNDKYLYEYFEKGDNYLFGKNWLEDLQNDNKQLIKISDNVFLAKVSTISQPPMQDKKLVVLTEINSLNEEKQELYELATKDLLTGCINRAGFELLFEHQLYKYKRYKTPFSMIFFDIDFFKEINDNLGHQCGDDMLFELAKEVEAGIRRSDMLARWGGDEFVIILPNTQLKQAVALAEKLKNKIAKKRFVNDIAITLSFSIAQIEKDMNLKQMIHKLDKALYKAKENGRDRIET